MTWNTSDNDDERCVNVMVFQFCHPSLSHTKTKARSPVKQHQVMSCHQHSAIRIGPAVRGVKCCIYILMVIFSLANLLYCLFPVNIYDFTTSFGRRKRCLHKIKSHHPCACSSFSNGFFLFWKLNPHDMHILKMCKNDIKPEQPMLKFYICTLHEIIMRIVIRIDKLIFHRIPNATKPFHLSMTIICLLVSRTMHHFG